ncbi:MAG: ComF family protein [Pirellulales bacterium]
MAWSDLPGIAAVVDLLVPPRCVFCAAEAHEIGGGVVVVCPACAAALSRDVERCPTCGEPSAAGASSCERCVRRRIGDGIVVLSAYGDEVRSPVLRAKRPGGEGVAAGLAALLVAKHADRLRSWQIDVVTPVPMHWLRRLGRGTSAAAQIGRGVARGLRLPLRPLLVRRRWTTMQNELPFEDRAANLRDAFHAGGAAAGRRVLLVDDVTTSGSTLAECRRVLVEAGAAAVYAAVVARADRGLGAEEAAP